MKAILCETYGPPSALKFKEIPSLTPGPKELLIAVKACAVNFPDTLIIQGKYQFRPELPFSPGSDFSGVVKGIGANVKDFNVGDAVFGVVPCGGYAEELLADISTVYPKPSNLDFKLAASYMYAYGTSYHALKDRAHLKAGETVVVLGAAGGVGLAAVELAKMMGARVIACASTDDKLALCKKYGADDLINYSKTDLKDGIKALTNSRGADVVLDPVGGDYAEAALRATAWEGRYLVVGFAAGTIPKIALNLALLKGCSIVGVFWGRFIKENPKLNMENGQEIFEWMQAGKINPHIHKVFALEETPMAIQEMMDRKVMGKIVVEINT